MCDVAELTENLGALNDIMPSGKVQVQLLLPVDLTVWQQIPQGDDHILLHHDLCSAIFVVQLADELPAASARRDDAAIPKYRHHLQHPALAVRHHRAGGGVFRTEAHRAASVNADPRVDLAVGREQRGAHAAGFRVA